MENLCVSYRYIRLSSRSDAILECPTSLVSVFSIRSLLCLKTDNSFSGTRNIHLIFCADQIEIVLS
jgi:hypothetical protein